jgi:hypothetical protein
MGLAVVPTGGHRANHDSFMSVTLDAKILHIRSRRLLPLGGYAPCAGPGTL